jgi:primosomal protein N' (replication factor Y)
MTPEPINKYLEVAVSAPIGRPLTYLSPSDCQQHLMPGMRVLVPLAGRKITGYILSTVDSAPSGQKIKEIYEVLDSRPLFPAEQVRFFKWIAKYYHYPIGEVIKTALPAGLTKKSGRRVVLTETGRRQGEFIKTELNTPWLSSLLDKGEISPHITGKLWPTKKYAVH